MTLQLTDLSKGLNFSLEEILIKGLRNDQEVIKVDEELEFTRSISTMTLYSKKGLEIYEEITKTEAYYPFNAELEILKNHGDEIAARMFGLNSDVLLTNQYLDSSGAHMNGNSNSNGGNNFEAELTPAANSAAKKEKWGDAVVGTDNEGVNGGLNGTGAKSLRSGLAIELGSGSLDKTRHLLRSVRKLLNPTSSSSGKPSFDQIEYRALDLERDSLTSTLTKLIDEEKSVVSPSQDGSPRVFVSGMVATYDQGLSSLDSSKSNSQPTSSSSNSTLSKSLLWLGSSVGNFTRPEAASFLKNIAENVLNLGDTMLIGIDNCDDGVMISNGYDDPEGVTRRFILEGVNVAGSVLGCKALKDENFDYFSRWNGSLGRHEAYVRCKVQGLEIDLPARGGMVAEKVVLKKDELLHIEFSYKYNHTEALELFNAAGLRLIQQWSDSRKLHSLYLVERPAFFFPSCVTLKKEAEASGAIFNPYGLPTLTEWDNLWKCWDMVTRELVPRHLLMKKPIPLRHIILFYLGHIPAFLDIHLSRYFKEPACEPASFHVTFERGIDPNVADPTLITHSHSVVPTNEADWPKLEEIVAFQGRVRERVYKVYKDYQEEKMTRRLARTLALMLEHEAMHMETLVYITLQAANKLNPVAGFQTPDFKSLSRFWNSSVKSQGRAARSKVLTFEAQTLIIGQDDDDRLDSTTPFEESHAFGWDVESPRREISVGSFKIDALPITNLEYFNFLASSETNSFTSKKNSECFPSSWSNTASPAEQFDQHIPILVKTLYGEIDFNYCQHWPVTASAKQLEAFAKAKGGRLPTHGELAVFFEQNPVDTPANNISFANLHPIPATLPFKQRDGSISGGDSGGVWMWTSSLLDAHPGFSSSLLYPGYSSDFHDGEHNIILGGSYVTIARFARKTGVNWYQGAYPFVVAGARVTYDC